MAETKLTQDEIHLAEEEGINTDALRIIKERIGSPFFRSNHLGNQRIEHHPKPHDPKICEYCNKPPGTGVRYIHIPDERVRTKLTFHNAIRFKVDADRLGGAFKDLQTELGKFDCHTYVLSDRDDDPKTLKSSKSYTAAVFSNLEQFEYLKFLSMDITSCPVEIDTLRKWNERYGFILIGVSHKWIRFILKSAPDDLADFCSGLVDMCCYTEPPARSLENAIKNHELIFMGW